LSIAECATNGRKQGGSNEEVEGSGLGLEHGHKRGFVLLHRRWVVERSFAWATRFRRFVKDYQRCAQTLADLHLIAFVCITLKNDAKLAVGS
jgi:hypothetical protein